MMVDCKQVRTHANRALTIINVAIHSVVTGAFLCFPLPVQSVVTGVLLCSPVPVAAVVILAPLAIHFTNNRVVPLVP